MDDDLVWIILGGVALYWWYTTQPVVAVTAVPATAAPAPSINGTAAAVTLVDTNTGSTSVLASDEKALITITGAPPNGVVSYVATVNGVVMPVVQIGSTDQNGGFTWSDAMSPGMEGTVSYQWLVNGAPVGVSNFTVVSSPVG